MTSTEIVSIILSALRLHCCDSAMLPRPATTKDIARCNKRLAELALPELPADYAELLQQCNGMAWNGVELYGTDHATDPSDGFELADIVSNSDAQDEYFAERIGVYEALYIGRSEEEIFVYNAKNKSYEIYDRTGMDVRARFGCMADMLFDGTVGARLQVLGRLCPAM
jgi:hypothetical protein